MTEVGEAVRPESNPEARASLGLSGAEHDLPTAEMPVFPYVICCAPRSGSTLLTQLLHTSGRLGVPAEYLNEHFLLPALGQRYGVLGENGRIMPNEYIRALVHHRTTPNRIFGIKVLFSQMERWVAIGAFRRMLLKSRLIWLRRRDTLAQAISLLIAQQTQQWHVGADGPGEPRTEPSYNRELVRRAYGTILSEEAGWQRFFEVNAAEPLVVHYEDLVADSDQVCQRICGFIGVTGAGPFRLEVAATRPTRGDLNGEWARRWTDDLRIRPLEGDG